MNSCFFVLERELCSQLIKEKKNICWSIKTWEILESSNGSWPSYEADPSRLTLNMILEYCQCYLILMSILLGIRLLLIVYFFILFFVEPDNIRWLSTNNLDVVTSRLLQKLLSKG